MSVMGVVARDGERMAWVAMAMTAAVVVGDAKAAVMEAVATEMEAREIQGRAAAGMAAEAMEVEVGEEVGMAEEESAMA